MPILHLLLLEKHPELSDVFAPTCSFTAQPGQGTHIATVLAAAATLCPPSSVTPGATIPQASSTNKPLYFTSSTSWDSAHPHPPQEGGEGERLRMELGMREALGERSP